MRRIEDLTIAIYTLSNTLDDILSVVSKNQANLEQKSEPAPEPKPESKRKPKPKPKPAAKVKPEPEVEPDIPWAELDPKPEQDSGPAWTHAEATAWVVDLSAKEGNTAEIVKVIKSFGVTKISDIPVDKLPKFRESVEALYE